MQTVQVGHLKSEFSNILKQVQEGETFIVEYGKAHKKVAMLVPYEAKPEKRVFGQLKGTFTVPNDFNEESDDINQLFYGDS